MAIRTVTRDPNAQLSTNLICLFCGALKLNKNFPVGDLWGCHNGECVTNPAQQICDAWFHAQPQYADRRNNGNFAQRR